MQAVVLERHGPPAVLSLQQAPDPAPRAGEVVVELKAIGVNRRDAFIRAGDDPKYRLPLPLILGSDGAGVRRDNGEEVVIFPSLRWGDREEVTGPGFEILGGPSDGTYAELVAVPAANVYAKPAGFSWQEAAAFSLAAVTAYRALFVVGRLRRGERLAILGTGGGVSLAALDLALDGGAEVAVTSSDPAKLRWARERGAAAAVDYRDPDWVEQVTDAIGSLDLVLDAVGSTWPDSIRLLGPGGRLVACGGTGGSTANLDVRAVYLEQKQILGTKMGSPADFAALLAILERTGLRPHLDSVLPLERAADAQARIETGEHFGKLVLDPRG
jgi:zinc-binding alcohol dehydrogenase/oxidoreductase